jgi:Concanavalin A-like lectin/glucanases superfamily
MGRMLLILIVIVTAVFATLTLTMRQSTDEYLDSVNENVSDLNVKELGKYAIDYAINQIQNGTVNRDNNIPFRYQGYYDLKFKSFNVLNGAIDSIRYTCLDVDLNDTSHDTILIRVSVNKGNQFWASEAIIGPITASGAVGFYGMDDGSGTNIADGSGNGFDGTLKNANLSKSWVSGVNGSGINLDGTNDRIDLDNGIAGSYGDQMTVACWAKLDPSFLDWGTLVAEQTAQSGYPVCWTLRSRLFDFWFYKSLKYAFDVVTSSTIEEVYLSKNNWQMDVYDWHFIVGTYDGNYSATKAEIKIQILDEGFVASKIINKWAKRDSTNTVSIGGRETNLWWFGPFACFDGTIDEVRLLDGIYDSADLLDMMNNTFVATVDRIMQLKEFAK